jgi:methylenetetrahydrofolate dehydrogenase (NADP+)/methenyltetrahydrofolate cyclohydrolase
MSGAPAEPGSGARLLDGRSMAQEMLAETRQEIAELTSRRGCVPEIRVLLVGDDAASAVYARRILRSAEAVGSAGRLVTLPGDADGAAVRAALSQLTQDPVVAGIIMQLPLPPGLELSSIIGALDPRKDLDGIHPFNAGLVSRGAGGFAPSCAEAAIEILNRSGIEMAGRPAVVVGRSNVVGRPAQLLLISEDATVTVCHRKTRDLDSQVRQAEIVIVAAGVAGLITGDAIQPGAAVIDCGINVLEDGTIVGDVDQATVLPIAGAITPVPGGVGPVTNAVLMRHLARAARMQLADPSAPVEATAAAG